MGWAAKQVPYDDSKGNICHGPGGMLGAAVFFMLFTAAPQTLPPGTSPFSVIAVGALFGGGTQGVVVLICVATCTGLWLKLANLKVLVWLELVTPTQAKTLTKDLVQAYLRPQAEAEPTISPTAAGSVPEESEGRPPG